MGDRKKGSGSTGALPERLRKGLARKSVMAGFLALCWLLLRSGAKPSRLAYPCQQAAFSAAYLAFAAPVLAGLLFFRRKLTQTAGSRAVVAIGVLGLVIATGTWGFLGQAAELDEPMLEPRAAYRAQVFHVGTGTADPEAGYSAQVRSLVELMGSQGLKFYRSSTNGEITGKKGLIGADDVVVVKINYQWDSRGGSNTDVLRGLIQAIVDHPDEFDGEIVVCENAQFASVSDFDRPGNNSEEWDLSPRDVVDVFRSEGYRVSLYDWTRIRFDSVSEYDEGDTEDGYIVYGILPGSSGRVSYPKFRTEYGTFVSLKRGVWDPAEQKYDRKGLAFINLPVLKSHNSTYGVTACVKNYMGVVTDGLSTNSHAATGSGLLGAVMAEIRPADLCLLDAVWINARPDSGPMTGYSEATRANRLIASADPIAADIWATSNILIPAFEANGYTRPFPGPGAEPDDERGAFRRYLDRSMNRLITAGYDVTNDLSRIDAFEAGSSGQPVDLVNLKTVGKAKANGSLILRCKVKNGSEHSSAPTAVGFYLSLDEELSVDDFFVGDGDLVSIKAGKKKSAKLKAIVGSEVTPGDYYVLSYADEGDLNNDPDVTNNSGWSNKLVSIR